MSDESSGKGKWVALAGCGLLVILACGVGGMVLIRGAIRGPSWADAGGLELVLDVQLEGVTGPERDARVDETREVIAARVAAFGIRRPEYSVEGDSIVVRLPEVEDADSRLIGLVTTSFDLQFRMVQELGEARAIAARLRPGGDLNGLTDSQLAIETAGLMPTGWAVLWQSSFDRHTGQEVRDEAFVVGPVTGLNNDSVEYASVSRDQFNVPHVRLEFDDAGTELFCTMSRENVGHRVAIVLDGEVQSAPMIQEAICGGVASITMGGGDAVEVMNDAQDLANALQAGGLGAPVTLRSATVVNPTSR